MRGHVSRLGLILCAILSVIHPAFAAQAICPHMAEGTSIKVTPLAPYFTDPAAGQFRLTRLPSEKPENFSEQTSEKFDGEIKARYEVILNLQISADTPDYIRFTEDCFRRLSEYLVGPNGEELSVRLPSDLDADLPKKHAVMISKNCGYRGSAFCWTPQYTCPLIMHETLHHLGLADEYADGSGYSGSKAKCRSIGPDDSLMSNTSKAAQISAKSYHIEFLNCSPALNVEGLAECEKSLAEIQNGKIYTAKDTFTSERNQVLLDGVVSKIHRDYLDLTPQQEYPIGDPIHPVPSINMTLQNASFQRMYHSDLILKDMTPQSLEVAMKARPKFYHPNINRLEITTIRAGIRKSILYPAQFTSIVYSTCAINDRFYRCEKNAYANSFCSIPKDCRDPSWVGLPEGVLP